MTEKQVSGAQVFRSDGTDTFSSAIVWDVRDDGHLSVIGQDMCLATYAPGHWLFVLKGTEEQDATEAERLEVRELASDATLLEPTGPVMTKVPSGIARTLTYESLPSGGYRFTEQG